MIGFEFLSPQILAIIFTTVIITIWVFYILHKSIISGIFKGFFID